MLLISIFYPFITYHVEFDMKLLRKYYKHNITGKLTQITEKQSKQQPYEIKQPQNI